MAVAMWKTCSGAKCIKRQAIGSSNFAKLFGYLASPLPSLVAVRMQRAILPSLWSTSRLNTPCDRHARIKHDLSASFRFYFTFFLSCQSTIIFCRADQNFPIIQQYGPTFWEYPKSWPDVNVWLPLPSEHTQSVAAVERIARNWSNLALSQNRNGFYLTIRKTQATWSAHYWGALSSPSGDLGIGLVWDILSPTPIQHFGTSVEIFKLSMMGPQLLSGWYQIFLDVQ